MEIEPPLRTIAIVRDRDSPWFEEIIAGFRAELTSLAGEQYRFELRDTFNADGDPASVEQVLREALAAPDVDVIYTAGFVATYTASGLEAAERTKPIVGGAVESLDLSSEHISLEGGSTLPNYTFIQSPRRVEADLEKLVELSGADTVYAIVDRFAFESLEGIYRPEIDKLEAKLGVRLQAVQRGETVEESVAVLPADARAVYLPILSGVEVGFRQRLFAALAERGVFTLSILGVRDVRLGAFAGLASDNSEALHRRIALNLHQILSGVPTELLPVLLRADDRLVINLRTAAALDWSPDYATSLAAQLLFEDSLFDDADELSLESAMSIASELNPQVVAAAARSRETGYAASAVRANYLPNLDLVGQSGALGVTERITPALTPAHSHSLSLGLELRQLLFSDRVTSQYRAQSLVAEASRLEEDSARLDAIAAAAFAFLDVLSAEALYAIEKENLQLIENNLQLAKLRRDIGAGEAVEIFRWQSSRAQARSDLFRRDSSVRTARVQLNVALGMERTRHWRLADIRLADDEFYFLEDSLSVLVKDLASFRGFIEFVRQEARLRAPEVQAFEKNIEAQGILLAERGRRNFVPEVQATAGFRRSLLGAHERRSDSENEWSVGVGFVLPAFDGKRTAETGQLRSGRDRLSAQRDQALFLVEQAALSAVYGMGATHPAMLFSREALTSATDNFEAVQTKYQEGAATILDLLDAQSALLAQKQSEALAGYAYLADVISLQRAISWFEFFASSEERARWGERLRAFLATR